MAFGFVTILVKGSFNGNSGDVGGQHWVMILVLMTY